MHIGENLLGCNWRSSLLVCNPQQFHWTIVAMIIGDLGRGMVERGVCGFVATDYPDVDSSGGPTPELTLGDGFPEIGSEVSKEVLLSWQQLDDSTIDTLFRGLYTSRDSEDPLLRFAEILAVPGWLVEER
ncbi:hypothetical protein Hamer_G000489 [Homarus americanus]|uniref:Uncharacterized protein n=1 Tax=Homarus americanus TaxID=6706 RepID=A0A8J5NDD1_HOMAM|nr:hypothetical protein Hamer_G000489 [Homarus americanus]